MTHWTTGVFSFDPSWETAPGMLQDVAVTASTAAMAFAPLPSVTSGRPPPPPQYYIEIENGVRRAIASREAQLGEIPATIYREGQPPLTTTLRLDQLHSPKPEIPLDQRLLNIQPPIQTPIQVQPLGLPGQVPTVRLNQVRIVLP